MTRTDIEARDPAPPVSSPSTSGSTSATCFSTARTVAIRWGHGRCALIHERRALVLYTSRTILSGREIRYLPRPPRASFDCSWAFVLQPAGDNGTRLLARTRIQMRPGWLVRVARVIRSGDNVMQRARLQGIKRRAERQRVQTRET